MLREIAIRTAIATTSALALSACVTTGGNSTAATGSAGGASSVDANAELERCDAPLGTLAVDDGRGSDWAADFGRATSVTTVEPLIRLAVQQSNCFVITSVGSTRLDSKMQRITDKQRESGEYRSGSNQQKGQRVAADYFLEPRVIIDNSPTSEVGGAIGGMLNNTLGKLAGSVESKASVVTLSLFDLRSSLQLSASEGSSTATNYGAAVSAFGSGVGGSLGGMTRTPEGKATVAAFLDAYNGMVVALRNYQAQDVEGGMGTGGTLEVN